MCPPVIRRLGSFILAVVLLGSLAVSQALAASITVNSLADVAANDGACTLREAIAAANTDTASGAAAGECAAGSGADTITFSVAGTITLTSALPSISTNLSMVGAGAVTVSGASTYRVFNITAGAVTLSGLSITEGAASAGAGILNTGTLMVTNSTISGSTAGTFGNGGGISNSGTLTVTNSTISGNSGNFGGGIRNTGTLTLTLSTISGNAAIGTGGVGGGVLNFTTATITNSTFSGNSSSDFGGGFWNNGSATATVTNSTFSGNSASVGGGLAAAGVDTLVNSIVAGNTASSGPDILGTVETNTTNVIGVPGGKTLADILVAGGPANNGGPTKTIALALVAGNPAIDAGTASACSASPVNSLDQRGKPRPAACDIGAYEAQPPTFPKHMVVSVAVSPPAPTVVTYTLPVATDEQGGVAAVACVPPSGSTFAVGTTGVTCTATDAVGHTFSAGFPVIVSGVAAPSAPAPSLPNSATVVGTRGAPGAGGILAFLLLLVLFSLVALWRVSGRVQDGTG